MRNPMRNPLHNYIYSFLLFLTLSIPAFAADKAVPPDMLVKYHFDPIHDTHRIYHRTLVERAMEITVPDYGPYRIEQGLHSGIAKRQAFLLSEGELINVHWAPAGTEIAKSNTVEIPIDFLYSLQGYRVCIIHEKSTLDFTQIRAIADLKKIRFGQGTYWVDSEIYNANGINPILATTLEGLYPMLGFQRFDCLALGINEIAPLLDENKKLYPFLTIEPSLLLHYNFPIYFYVSKKYPKLAERIEKGLRLLEANGEMRKLFLQFQGAGFPRLNLKNRQIICLKNPYLPEDKQCKPGESLDKVFTEF